MSSFPYCVLLLLFLHQVVLQSVVSVGTTVGVTTVEEDGKCNAKIIDKLSEAMDLVCEVNSRLNDTEIFLTELRKELKKNRDTTDAAQARLEKQHLENGEKIEKALSTLEENLSNAGRIPEKNDCVVPGPRDCSDIRSMGFTTSGIYRIYPGHHKKRMAKDVYCDYSSFKESWLVFQRRKDGSEDFVRNYTQYEQGFGDLNGEFWLGNEALNMVSTQRKYKLRIDLEDFNGEKRYAEYSTFVVNSTADFYRLTVAGYSGNAGNSFGSQNNSRFTTLDMDNDIYKPANCAVLYRGGWWYTTCHESNLNGLYLRGNHTSWADGINWQKWHGLHYSLKKTEMKLMPLVDGSRSSLT